MRGEGVSKKVSRQRWHLGVLKAGHKDSLDGGESLKQAKGWEVLGRLRKLAFTFWPSHAACRILVLCPGIEPGPRQ